MPTNLVDDPTTFPDQTSPVAGEPRTAGSVETPFQRSANRTAYLKNQLGLVQAANEGIRRIRSVASVAALQALTDRPDGTVVEVAGTGLYRFDGASILSELSPIVVKPTAIVHPAPGRWLVHGYGMINAANGIAGLDVNGKVAGTRLAIADASGRIVGTNIVNGIAQLVAFSSNTAFVIPADTTYRAYPPSIISLDLVLGDLVCVDYSLAISYPASERISGLIRIVKPDTSVVDDYLAIAPHSSTVSNIHRMHLFRVYPVPVPGSYTFSAQVTCTSIGAGGGSIGNGNHFRIAVYRP